MANAGRVLLAEADAMVPVRCTAPRRNGTAVQPSCPCSLRSFEGDQGSRSRMGAQAESNPLPSSSVLDNSGRART